MGESGENRQRRAADALFSVVHFANSAVSVAVVGPGDGDRFHNCSCSPTFLHIHAPPTPAGSGRFVVPCSVKIQYDTDRNSNILGCVFSSRFGSVSLSFFLNRSCCPVQPTHRCLTSILGKSNLQFAGMTISLTISTSSLNLLASDCKQVRLKRVELARRYFCKRRQTDFCPVKYSKILQHC